MSIKDVIPEGIVSLIPDNLSDRTALSDLRSILVRDAAKVDPTFDITGARTETQTSPELLSAVPEFSGFEFDPTQQSYVEDLYALYSGGVPTRDVAIGDTAQIPGAIDTLVSPGDMDQATSDSVLDSAPIADLIQSGTFADQPTFTTTPGTIVDNISGDITNPDGSYGGNIVDEFDPTTPLDTSITVEDLTQPSNIGDFQVTAAPPLGNLTGDISEAPQIASQLGKVGPTTIQGPLSQVEVPGVTPEDIQQAKIDEIRLGSYKPSFETVQQENTIQSIIGKAGQTVDNALNELGKIPGAVVDFANQTVDVFGRKLNVGKTLASAAINTLAKGPISLVFDAVSNIEPSVSQIEYDSYTEDQQNAIDEAYGPGGVMEGYNKVSAFGRGPKATVESRLEERTSKGIFDSTTDKLNNLSNKLGGITITAPTYDFDDTTTTTTTPSGNTVDVETGDITDPTGVNVGNIFDEVALTGGGPTSDDDPAGPLEGPGITADDAFGDDGPSNVGGPPSGPGVTADEGFGGDGPSDASTSDAQAAANREAARESQYQDRDSEGSASSDAAAPSAPSAQDAQRGGQYEGRDSGNGGGGGGGGKIVCTMMNESYGFGSFRNKIWLRHSKNLAPEYQIGYHKIFLPLVKISKTNKIIKKILEHIAVHRTIDIRQESRGKMHILGRVYRKILEPICYWVGKYAKR